MRILFVDPVTPKPYCPITLSKEPLGGTEATVVRIAEGLSEFVTVRVTQHNRTESSSYQGKATYTPFGANHDYNPTHVVVLRAPMALYQAKKQFPSAKLYFWAHDMFGGDGWVKGFQAFVDTNCVPIVVSDWHKSQMYDAMRQVGFTGSVPSRRLYNPIDDALNPNDTPVDTNKLLFFSSPHKGLDHTLKIFERFKDFEELKDMKLYIANPGYFENKKTEGLNNVVNLGSLSHAETIQHVRSALCVFHLNNVFAETFGLVHAEANAVGTPFLSSHLGATPELCDHPGELIDVSNTKAVIDRIITWKQYGRPKVRAIPYLRLSKIVKEWVDFLKL